VQQIVDYIIANWQWILPIVVSVVEFFILFIFRRGKVSLSITSHLIEDVIHGIQIAEERWPEGNGGTKHQFVRDFIREKYGWFFYQCLESEIDFYIDKILSTPQKKGGN